MLELKSIGIDIDDYCLIKDLSFIVNKGQLIHLKGRNGAGKTTLLRTITGLSRPASGSIILDKKLENTDIGYIGHLPLIEPLLTTKENIQSLILGEKLHLDLKGALTKLDLLNHQHKFANQLSQGQKKRLSLSKFFMVKKSLWLLDEPFSALDSEHQAILKQSIIEYVAQGGSVLLTSHLNLDFKGIDYREHDL